jgi:transposase
VLFSFDFLYNAKSILNKHFRLLIVERILKGLSYREVTKQLNISKSEVSKIFLHFKKYGYVKELSPLNSGRLRLLSADDIKYLESLLKEKIDWYIWKLQSEMELWLGHRIPEYPTIPTIIFLKYPQFCCKVYLN